MRLHIYLIFMITFPVSSLFVDAEQKVISETIKHHRDQVEKLQKYVTMFHDALVEVSNDKEKAILANIKYEFPISNDITNAYASYDGKTNKVVIGSFISSLVYQLGISYAVSQFDSDDGSKATTYAMYSARLLLENTRRSKAFPKSQEPLPQKSYFHYYDVPISVRQEYFDNKRVRELIHEVYLASIFYTLTHELGHHVRRHLHSKNEQSTRWKEQQADNWAFEKMIELNTPTSVLHILPMIYYYVSLECLHQTKYQFARNTHPGWLERYQVYIEFFLSESKKDEKFVKQMRDKGRYDAYLQSYDVIMKTVANQKSEFQNIYIGCEL
jgi:hypothetical protein